MKRIKLKNRSSIIKKRLAISILLSVVFTMTISIILIRNLSDNLLDYVARTVKKENILIMKNAFSHTQNASIDIDSLITVIKNSKEEITEVSFDMKASSNLLSEITSYMNENLGEYNFLGYRIDIPVGLLSNNPLFANLGPKVPVKVEMSDVALGNVRTAVKPFGINSALVEVYLDIYVRTSILYPFNSLEANDEFSTLIASKIISGTVPNFFGGTLNSTSDTINVPLKE